MFKNIKNRISNNALLHNYRRMWPFIKPYTGRALLGILLTIPAGALDAAIAAFMRPFMDIEILEKQSQFSMLLPIAIVSFTLVQGVLGYASTYFNTWVGVKISNGIRRVLFDRLLSMDTLYFDQNSSGEVMRRFSKDADSATAGLVDNLKLFLTRFFSSIALIAVMLYNSWQLAVVGVMVLGLVYFPLKLVKKMMKSAMDNDEGAGANIFTIYNETFNGNKIIHSFALEEHMKEQFAKRSNMMFANRVRIARSGALLSALLNLIRVIGIALIIGFGGYLITVSHSITPGAFVAFVAAFLMLYAPLRTIGDTYVKVQRSFMAIDRIFQIFGIKPEIVNNSGTTILEKINKNIEFNDVSFAYGKRRNVLNGISFEINVGQVIALVGNSGGGKTTISSLIPRLYDVADEGAILIDGINIKEYTLESLRSNIAMVFQDNFLFSGTIRENLFLGNKNATEEMMWQALKNAHLDMFVKSLDNGLDTEIGERGVLLSGGQKQRIAIARAFIKNAPIVILDEATSALDNKAEQVVQRALDNLMENRTVIVIAHRLSTIQNADNILVINDGRIIEQGTHDTLLAQQGAYYELYAMQFK